MPGGHTLAVTATDEEGLATSFDFRVIVQKATDLGPDLGFPWLRAQNVDCHIYGLNLLDFHPDEFVAGTVVSIGYSGDCVNRKAHGHGVLFVELTSVSGHGSSSVRYEGEWRAGALYRGTYSNSLGTEIRGEFGGDDPANTIWNASGTVYYGEGSMRVGEWRDGLFHQGTFTAYDGSTYSGEWRRGFFIAELTRIPMAPNYQASGVPSIIF